MNVYSSGHMNTYSGGHMNVYSGGYMKLSETKVAALEVERKLWIYRLSSYASRHYCIIEVLLCFITILICDEADNIFWSYNGSISMSHEVSHLYLVSELKTAWQDLPRRPVCNPLTPTHPSGCHSQMASFSTSVITSIISESSPEIFLMKPLSLLRNIQLVKDLLPEIITLGLAEFLQQTKTMLLS